MEPEKNIPKPSQLQDANTAEAVSRPPDLVIPVESINVTSWCPDDHAQEPPEQVHLLISVPDLTEAVFIMRLKSRRSINALIDALIIHRDDVWPEPAP